MTAVLRINPWAVLICGGLLGAISFGVRSTFGLFQQPMVAANGWTIEQFALAMAVQNLLWGLAQPFFGVLIDKFGTARIAALGGLLYMAGVGLMAVSESPWMLQLSGGVIIGLALSGTGFGIVLPAIGRAFPPSKRSFALGVGGALGSFGQFAFALGGNWFLESFDWFVALLILAGFCALMVPLAAALRGGASSAGHAEEEESATSLGAALTEVSYHPSFWCLNLGFFVCGFHVAFIAVHIKDYVVLCGLPGSVGAWSIALIGLFNIVGSLAAGHLGGRFPKKWLLSTIYFLRAVVIALFLFLPVSTWTVAGFSIFMGLLWLSTVPLTSGLVGFIYGPRFMATLFGIVFLAHQVGAFFGSWLGGYMFDRTGSYDLVWYMSIALGLLAAAAHMPIIERAIQRAPATATAS